MAQHVKFIKRHDYRHKSGAVTAYEAGMVEYLPDHIANDPQLEGKIEPADKPARTRVYLEDDRYSPENNLRDSDDWLTTF